ncbi:MAG: hypothetical protein M1822_005923 [Bathelium mastoideum]|nr:MAG: hypothetical protein M1822_005923 [Bathelium mastoideum]
MNEALSSILSGEEQWSFYAGSLDIKFRKDGRGELWCRNEFNYWILAELRWKSLKSSNSDQDMASTWAKTPRLLGQLDIEITLINQLPKCAEGTALSSRPNLNADTLVDDAFQPKSYTIKIERGNFIEPCCIGYTNLQESRFALRLVFDKSPYPPRSEWKEPEGGPDGGQFWDIKEFVARESRDLRKQGRAMNDPSAAGWNRCEVM